MGSKDTVVCGTGWMPSSQILCYCVKTYNEYNNDLIDGDACSEENKIGIKLQVTWGGGAPLFRA